MHPSLAGEYLAHLLHEANSRMTGVALIRANHQMIPTLVHSTTVSNVDYLGNMDRSGVYVVKILMDHWQPYIAMKLGLDLHISDVGNIIPVFNTLEFLIRKGDRQDRMRYVRT
jgi:hypothetical protein